MEKKTLSEMDVKISDMTSKEIDEKISESIARDLRKTILDVEYFRMVFGADSIEVTTNEYSEILNLHFDKGEID